MFKNKPKTTKLEFLLQKFNKERKQNEIFFLGVKEITCNSETREFWTIEILGTIRALIRIYVF